MRTWDRLMQASAQRSSGDALLGGRGRSLPPAGEHLPGGLPSGAQRAEPFGRLGEHAAGRLCHSSGATEPPRAGASGQQGAGGVGEPRGLPAAPGQ